MIKRFFYNLAEGLMTTLEVALFIVVYCLGGFIWIPLLVVGVVIGGIFYYPVIWMDNLGMSDNFIIISCVSGLLIVTLIVVAIIQTILEDK